MRLGKATNSWGFSVAAALFMTLGCLSPARVTTDSETGVDLSGYRTVLIAPLVVKNDVVEQGSPLAEAIVARAVAGLEGAGLRVAEGSDAELLARLEVDRQQVLRRVVSSDPDDNSTVRREVPEAIVVVDLIDRGTREIVWRGIGTRRIPNVRIPVLMEYDDVWLNAMERVTAEIPSD